MKKIIIILLLIYFKTSFSQKKVLNQELQISYLRSTIATETVLENNTERSFFYHSKFIGFGAKYKYFTKYELLTIGILYQQTLPYTNNDYYYSSNQLNIPIGYSLYFFKKTWFNPSIGFSINNNLVFNEKIRFSYGADTAPFIPTIEENEIKFRYQIAFVLNGGLSFTIKKRYTLNINGFVDLFSNYKLNPKGEETIPYRMYGYNFGVGYKF